MLKKALLFCSLLTPAFSFSQNTFLPLGSEDYYLLDRLETRSGTLTNEFNLSVKPVSRKGAVSFLLERKAAADEIGLTNIDRYNIDHAISVSGEWTPDGHGAIDSKLPWFKTFYKKQPDFLYVNEDNFFLVVNPVISAQGLFENRTNKDGEAKFMSSRGIELRGTVAKKIGFYTFVADNQEKPVGFVEDWIMSNDAIPGADFYRTEENSGKKHKDDPIRNYDYILARGYVNFEAIKDVVNVTFGYDKHFIGDGIRSLVLSDFAASSVFLKLNTRIWKLNYQNLFMELTPQFTKKGDGLLGHKYAAMHHLSMNLTKWLNVGLYENVVFGRNDRFEFGYMIPLIFYRAIERGLGSPDNVNLGMNFKAIALKHVQFYGQFMLDEFKSSELFGGNGWWGNKFGLQLGGKYFDAFTIKNLDLQAELNLVRPYTYSRDSASNYTHYNQPLAHPLGAGFAEFIGVVKYQPVKNLYVTIKGMYYNQGVDTGSKNYGADIFKDYNTRASNFGIELINGVKTSCMLMNLNLSYELKENFFIDLGATSRKFTVDLAGAEDDNTTYIYGGFRLNIARRDYDFR